MPTAPPTAATRHPCDPELVGMVTRTLASFGEVTATGHPGTLYTTSTAVQVAVDEGTVRELLCALLSAAERNSPADGDIEVQVGDPQGIATLVVRDLGEASGAPAALTAMAARHRTALTAHAAYPEGRELVLTLPAAGPPRHQQRGSPANQAHR